jgi:tripartite ATP-independent transporter DctM subunit
MSNELLGLMMFASLLIGIALGIPLAFALGGIGVVFAYFLWGFKAISMILLSSYGVSSNSVLVAVPLFILIGILLERSRIAEGLYDMMYRWSGGLRGSLAMATVVICIIFGAMTGVAAAATITMGVVALPSMLSRNYDKRLSVGTIAAAGTLPILIPPSIPMIILSMMTQQSVGKLFAAGLVPGLLMAFLFISYIALRAFFQPELCPAIEVSSTWREKIGSLLSVIAPMLIILAVLGTMFTGIATPTEAAATGAFCCLICVIAYGRFSWRLIRDVVVRTATLCAMVVWIMIGATAFVVVYTRLGAIDAITEIALGLDLNRWVIMVVMLAVVFVLGMFLDPTGIIMLCGPMFTSIAKNIGFDPLAFGILFIMDLQTGYLTPPFGYSLFYMRSLCPPDIRTEDIYYSIIPFVGLMVVAIFLILVFPSIATWLPNILLK